MIAVSGQPNGQGGPASAPAGGLGGPTASAPGGSPKRMNRQRPPGTFAGMQQQGQARPDPYMVQQQTQAQQALQQQTNAMQQQGQQAYTPNVQSAMQGARQTVDNAAAGRNLGEYRTSENAQALGQPLMQQVMALLADPTQGLNEAAQSNFDRQNRTLGREFTTLREGLNENMAARGLDASTIAATKLGELGARQAEAQGDVSARIQEQLIRDRAGAMQAAITSAMGLRGQEEEMGRNEFVVNRDTGELEFQRGMDVKKLDQDASQFSQRLNLDSQLGFGGLEIQRGNLDLNRDRFGFERETDARDFGYRQERDSVGDSQFDRRFDFDVSRDARDFDYRQDRDTIGDQQWQSGFDRQDRWRGEDNQYRDSRDVIGDARYREGFDRDQTWRNEDTSYRTDRDRVGDDRFNRTFDRENDWFNTGQTNQTTNQMLSFLGSMGINNLPPGMMESIMRSLGVNPPAGGSSAPLSRPPQNWQSGGDDFSL